jgi:hypothetical protein
MDRRRNLRVRRESVFAVVGFKSWGSCDLVKSVCCERPRRNCEIDGFT